MKYHANLETEDGRNVTTWGIIPIANNSKILHGIFNPESKTLQIVFDSVTEKYHDYPIVSEKNGKVTIQQRKLDTYYNLSIPEEDISVFLENYVDNNFEIEAKIHSKLIVNETA